MLLFCALWLRAGSGKDRHLQREKSTCVEKTTVLQHVQPFARENAGPASGPSGATQNRQVSESSDHLGTEGDCWRTDARHFHI